MMLRSFRAASHLAALAALATLPVLASQGCSAPPDGSTAEGADPSSNSAESAAATRPIQVMKWRSPDDRAASAARLQRFRAETAPAGAHLTYYGGRVVSNIHIVQVLWGSGSYLSNVSSTASPSMATFYQGVTNSPYVDWLTEYDTPASGGTNQTIGRGTFVGQYTITPSSGSSTISDATIQTELANQIAAGHLPPPTQDAAGNDNTYYAVFFPHGKTITQGGSNSCQAGGFCAYHGTVANAGGHEIYYGVHPDMQAGSGCDTGCGNGTPFGNYTSVASHEMTETITDCEVGLATTNAPPLAWYDNNNGEIGDICNAQQGSIVGSDGVTYTVQQEFSNVANDCITSRTVAANDFSVSTSSPTLSVVAGSSGSDTVTTAVTSGSAETVTFSASGAPSGVTVSFAPTSVSSGASASVTFIVSSSAAAGTYPISITGTAATGSHATSVSLTVTSGTVASDFSIAVTPASLSVQAGNAGTSTVDTAIAAGAAETVALSATGAPSGVTVSFSPTSVTSGGASTATIATTAAAAAGTYTITMKGTSGSTSHTAALSLTITAGTTSGGIVNGGFETGTYSGWTPSGASDAIISSGCHGGAYCAELGAATATNGDSTAKQTFTVPAGKGHLSVWYKMTCPDTVRYDWATVTLKDDTAGTSKTVLSRTCRTGAWKDLTATVVAGHAYTLTLLSHDDDYAGDPTFTLYDDVTLY